MSKYLFDQSPEQRRLEALSALHDPDTFACLDELGLAPGWHCLEVGAGSGSVARWMAARVGPGGRVVATDLELRGLGALSAAGVEVRQHDVARDPLEERAFDLIHARAVLQHVPGREAALDAMVKALRPGGTLCLEDVLMPHGASHPPIPAWTKIIQGLERQLRAAGADPYYGLALHGTLASRLDEVRSRARVVMMYSGTPSMDVNLLSLEQIADRLVGAGVVTRAEVDDALAAFRSPGHTLASAIMVQAWGRARE